MDKELDKDNDKDDKASTDKIINDIPEIPEKGHCTV